LVHFIDDEASEDGIDGHAVHVDEECTHRERDDEDDE
jgi:hypothetical protein